MKMKNYSLFLKNSSVWLILSILCACCMAFYVGRVWSADQPPGFSDLYAPWWGAHELFLHGRNPYSADVAHEIQTQIYGAPVLALYPGDPSQFEGGFAYPVYAAFALWPAVYLKFSSVQLLFFLLSIPLMLGTLWLWIRAGLFRMTPIQIVTLAFFSVGSFPALQAIRLQNLTLLAVTLLAAGIFLLATQRLILAGILLAAATLKPQFVVVLIPWLALWVFSDWRRRQRLAWSFLASMLLLTAGSEWLQPGWITRFLGAARGYTHYTFGRSLLDVWFTDRAGPFLAAALLGAVFAFTWQNKSQDADSPGFYFAVSLMLAATLVVIPTLAPHAQLLLLPGFLCLHQYPVNPSRSNRLARLLVLSAWLLLAWPWVAAEFLTVAAASLPRTVLSHQWELPLYTSPIMPFVVLLALVCLIRARSRATHQFAERAASVVL